MTMSHQKLTIGASHILRANIQYNTDMADEGLLESLELNGRVAE